MNVGVLNLIVNQQVVLDLIKQGIVIVWPDHLHMQRHHRLLAYHPYLFMVHIADFRDFQSHTTLHFSDIHRYRFTLK